MRNAAYTLSLLAAGVGIVLLTVASPGNDVRTALGTLLLVAAGVVAGIGKAIDLLGYVREGAADSRDTE